MCYNIKFVPIIFIIVFLAQLCPQKAYAQVMPSSPIHIKYISKEAVYVNAGKNDGLAQGDTLTIHRGKKLTGFAVVVHLSRKSAACRLIRSLVKIRVGDSVRRLRSGSVKAQAGNTIRTRPKAKRPDKSKRKPARASTAKSINQVRGYFSVQSYWQQAKAGAALSSFQPSFSGKLRVKNLAGTGLTFRLRQRSRLYQRSQSSYYPNRENEWIHRFFEICLSYDVPDSPWQFGFGRVYSPHIRGIGQIDGAHFSAKINPNIRIGLAAGKEPDVETSSFQTQRMKYGAYVTLETGSYQQHRLATTIAASASYEKGVINREFVYLQNNYWLANRLSIYQSVEIDLNRYWRKSAAGADVTFSNFYLTANVFITKVISANFSFDARKNVRTLTALNTPDSLFDDTMREGISGGLRVVLPANMRVGANLSMRFQEDAVQNTLFASFYYSVRHFPRRGHSISARLSFISTQFTKGYRPSINYRVPVNRHLTIHLVGGGYIYQNSSILTKSYYTELQAYYTFMRRYFLSANFRRYLDAQLNSSQFFVEAGVNF